MNSRWRFRVALFGYAVLLCWIPSLATGADGGQPLAGNKLDELRWNLKAGQNFKIELVQDMKQTFDVGGGEQEMPMNFTMGMSWTVDEAKENEFKITQIIDRIKVSMDLPGMGEVVFDSDSAEQPQGFAQQFASSLKPLVGMKIVQTINGRGQSVHCDIDSAALAGLSMPGAGGQFANEDMLKNLIGQSACVLPEGSIEKGASWDDKISMKNPQMGTMVTSAKYTYDGSEQLDNKSLEKILVESNVTIEPAENAQMEVEITKQDNKGTVYFDNVAGYVASATMNQSMSMQIAMMGQDVNVVTSGSTVFTMKPSDGAPKKDETAEKKDEAAGDGK